MVLDFVGWGMRQDLDESDFGQFVGPLVKRQCVSEIGCKDRRLVQALGELGSIFDVGTLRSSLCSSQ